MLAELLVKDGEIELINRAGLKVWVERHDRVR